MGVEGIKGASGNTQEIGIQPTNAVPQQAVVQSESTLNNIEPAESAGQPSRIAKPLSLMAAAGVGAGATYGVMHGISTGALTKASVTSFFTGAAIKSLAAMASYVGVSALLTAVSGFVYKKVSSQLNRINNGLEKPSQNVSNLAMKKFLAGLSFLGSSTALGLSTGSLVTVATGGADFGMSLIIGGVAGFAAGLLGLALMGKHNDAASNALKNKQSQVESQTQIQTPLQAPVSSRSQGSASHMLTA